MSTPPRRCTCLTFDDLCPTCATYGKAQANHQRFLSRTPRAEEAPGRRRRATLPAAPTTAAARLAVQRHITVDEAAGFLERQAASREAEQWQTRYRRRTP